MLKNDIKKSKLKDMGRNFIPAKFLPKGKDEYYLRYQQNKQGLAYRSLRTREIDILIENENTCSAWGDILVAEGFDPRLVRHCNFYGLVRIGKLAPACLEFSDMQYSVGLYNSTIINCDFGNNVAIENVHYLSHYIIGHETIIVNVMELATTNHAKFGNGILKEGEKEATRIELELWNENGGRRIYPFSGMLAGDAYLWSRYRNDDELMERFKTFTTAEFSSARGEYGEIGDRNVIKNCSIIKDVKIGDDAYIKGANKLKNLTIHSGKNGKAQIGEGCELVNGIIHEGCRIFYGVKAVRFIMASHSQLKYGARLINSYLGNNATISCCEVLNSLIFPLHEQHHNNSFLCASLVMGQSNIPAGATLGSNHNSRSADGEMQAGRGFWPGLCVSTKHNSQFASFTMLAKGDYNYELNIQIPFSLVSQDMAKDRLLVLPGYWFMYNLYALERNVWKYRQRDHRTEIKQVLEFDYLAPDSVNEMIKALSIMETAVGKAWYVQEQVIDVEPDSVYQAKGRALLLSGDRDVEFLQVELEGFENAKRKTILLKPLQAYKIFIRMIRYYAITQFAESLEAFAGKSFNKYLEQLPANPAWEEWENIGGQLLPGSVLKKLLKEIKSGKIKSWSALHAAYLKIGDQYALDKRQHGLGVLKKISAINLREMTRSQALDLLLEWIETRKWIAAGVEISRVKDYTNPFRRMSYQSEEEMHAVLGTMPDNTFIQLHNKEAKQMENRIRQIIQRYQLT